MDGKDVRRHKHGEILWLTLDRPNAMNALSPNMIRELDEAVAQADADDTVRCVVITGEGRAFCAGADLSMVPSDQAGLSTFLQAALRVMGRIEALSKPVIACANGLTLAGGLELLLCADIVVAARSARIGDVHAQYGLLPGGGGSARLPRAIGLRRARYLLYTAEQMSANELEQWGLVQRVYEDAELIERTQELAEGIAAKSPLALSRIKHLLAAGADLPVGEAIQAELKANEAHAHSHDMAEGLAAFAEKRKPVFTGR